MLCKVEFDRGVLLVNAIDEDHAEEWACAEFGRSSGPYVASEATAQDIAWVRGMGGMTHTAR